MVNKNVAIGSIALIIFIIAIIYANVTNSISGNSIKKDVFEGKITNMNLEPMILQGTGVYDRSCNMINNGLTQCDAGIQTEKGLLNFNYIHNMEKQPCISEGEALEVEILDSGKAKVRRLG